MARHALIWTQENKIVMIDYDIEPQDDHTVVEVPEEIEPWRFSLDDDGDLVIAYEGKTREEALASLKVDQEKLIAEEEAIVKSTRPNGD